MQIFVFKIFLIFGLELVVYLIFKLKYYINEQKFGKLSVSITLKDKSKEGFIKRINKIFNYVK